MDTSSPFTHNTTHTHSATQNDKYFTLISYGTHIEKELELIKLDSERDMIFPIGYCCVRDYDSYKNLNTKTSIKCEIDMVDENYFSTPFTPGNRFEFLFRITFQDDIDNPIEILKSPKFIATELKKRFDNSKGSPDS